MLNNDSRWGYDNGLQSLIPTLLHFGVVGYPFLLPDMIGGNAYGDDGFPSAELYVRWIHANAFMPSVQLAIVPWD
jgi:alpha-glucosidase (family GH31 glycosyl hydrolase)